MKYLSVCSGIEAASVAWHPLGWAPFAFSEIEPFPSAVLAHHYPTVPNFGDMTQFKEWPDADVDVLVGGTPCQSFSVAGLRKGLADPRGNLMLTYGAIAAKYRPRRVVWENVPGVLSSNGGRDFGTFLGMLGQLGYGFAYRILDAQYVRVDGFGRAVPQRRRRVFVVGCLGGWRSAAAVLFERESLRRNSAPSRKAGEGIAGTVTRRTLGSIGADDAANGHLIEVAGCLNSSGGRAVPGNSAQDADQGYLQVVSAPPVSLCLNAGAMGRLDWESETLIPTTGAGFDVAHALRGEGFDASEDGTGRGTPLVYTLAIRGRGDSHNLEYRTDGSANAILTPNGGRAGIGVGAIAFDCKASGQSGFGVGQVASTQRAMGHANSHTNGGGHQAVFDGYAVRRLTPTECARLQGFPDEYLSIPYRGKPAADGPKYKALGNSMAVNVMRWIGQRIQSVEQINARSKAA